MLAKGLLPGRFSCHLRRGMHLLSVSQILKVAGRRLLVVRHVGQRRQLRLHLLAVLLHVHFLHGCVAVVEEPVVT